MHVLKPRRVTSWLAFVTLWVAALSPAWAEDYTWTGYLGGNTNWFGLVFVGDPPTQPMTNWWPLYWPATASDNAEIGFAGAVVDLYDAVTINNLNISHAGASLGIHNVVLTAANAANTGTLTLESVGGENTSGLSLSGILWNYGTINSNVGSGGDRILNGGIANIGTVHVNMWTQVTGVIANAGSIDAFGGSLRLSAGSTFQQSAGGFSGQAWLDHGQFTWDGGTVNGQVLLADSTLALNVADGGGSAEFTCWYACELQTDVPANTCVVIEGAGGGPPTSTLTVPSAAANNGLVVLQGGGAASADLKVGADGAGTLTNRGTLKSQSTDPSFPSSFHGHLVNANTGEVRVAQGTLAITGSTLANDGTITVIPDGPGVAELRFDSDVTLSGTGSVILLGFNGTAEVSTTGAATLTQAAGHRIRGYGLISARLDNAGTVINDSAAGLSLAGSDKSNTGTFQSGGLGLPSLLYVEGITVTQSGAGQILADGGEVLLTGGATIAGGMLNTTGSGAISNYSGTNTLTDVTNLGALDVLDGTTLAVTGSTLVNNGTITLHPEDSFNATATLRFDDDVALTGSGSVVLHGGLTDPGFSYAELGTGPGATVTQASGHAIRGRGRITAALDNAGRVIADDGYHELVLTEGPKGNSGALRATADGRLHIYQTTVTQTGAGEIANAGGAVYLTDARIVGGTLRTADDSFPIEVFSGIGTELTDVTNLGTFLVRNGTGAHVSGSTLVNEGIIKINPYAGPQDTFLTFDSPVALSGSGQIILGASGPYAQLNTGPGGEVTQAADHTIRGYGQINAALTNAGTVQADKNGEALYLGTYDMANSGTFKATNNSDLDIQGIAITQSGAGQIVAEDGDVWLSGGTRIIGGTLRTATDRRIVNFIGANGLMDVTNLGAFEVYAGTTLAVTGSSLVNDGRITVNPGGFAADTVLEFNTAVTLGGTGSVFLSAVGSSAQLNAGPEIALTQDSPHTIHGFGQVNADMVNYGLVQADVSGEVLEVNAPTGLENHGTLRATEGGILRFVGGSVINAGDIVIPEGSTFTSVLYWQTAGSVTVDGAFEVVANFADILGGVADFNTDLGSETAADLTLIVGDALVNFGSDQHLETLAIGDGGKVVLKGAHVVVLNQLVIDGSDLGAMTLTPEPATLTLLALGGLGALLRCRRK